MSYASITPDQITGESSEIGFSSIFTYESSPASPMIVEDEHGIRLILQNLSLEESIINLDISVTYTFPRSFISNFARVEDAIILVVDRPDLGKSDWFNLSDPHTDYIGYDDDNFHPPRGESLEGTITSFCNVPAVFQIEEILPDEQVFVRALLQDYTSNVASIRLVDDSLEIRYYLNGEDYEPLSIEEFERPMMEGADDD